MQRHIPLVSFRPVIRGRDVSEYRAQVIERRADDGVRHGVERWVSQVWDVHVSFRGRSMDIDTRGYEKW